MRVVPFVGSGIVPIAVPRIGTGAAIACGLVVVAFGTVWLVTLVRFTKAVTPVRVTTLSRTMETGIGWIGGAIWHAGRNALRGNRCLYPR